MEFILPEQQGIFVRELEPHVLKCVKDANGNHVIQKLIERVSPDRLGFVQLFRGNVYDLSTHPYGCRVLQRCFEHLPEEQTRPLMDELHKYMINLMQDQFGVGSLRLDIYGACLTFYTVRITSFNSFSNKGSLTIVCKLSPNFAGRC